MSIDPESHKHHIVRSIHFKLAQSTLYGAYQSSEVENLGDSHVLEVFSGEAIMKSPLCNMPGITSGRTVDRLLWLPLRFFYKFPNSAPTCLPLGFFPMNHPMRFPAVYRSLGQFILPKFPINVSFSFTKIHHDGSLPTFCLG
jgi:hypothetical protein